MTNLGSSASPASITSQVYTAMPKPKEPEPELVLPGAFAAALVEASAELSNVAMRGRADTGTYKYRFATLPDVLDVARPVLHAHGLAHVQLVATEPFEKGVHVTVQTMLVHQSGATFTSPTLRLTSASPDPQRVGTAITYGRRYSLMATLGIIGDDDDDDAASHAATGNASKTAQKRVENVREPASYRSENEAETRRVLNAAPADVRAEVQRQFLEHFGLPLSKLPKDRHAEALAFVTERLAPAGDEPDALELS
jgi:hypothetical protein